MNACTAWKTEPKKSTPPSPKLSPTERAGKRWFAATPERVSDVVGQLYAAHRHQVTAYLLRWGLDRAAADDVTAEVFLIALKKLPSYQSKAPVSSWLVGIARRLAADYRRSARARYETLVDEVPEHEGLEGLDEALERREVAREVRCAIDALRPGPRGAVLGYALEDVPMKQVARQQKVPMQTAYARLYAAHTALRASLAPLAA